MPVTTSCPYCALQCAMTLTPSGSGAVVAAGGGGLTNEKAYLLGKFARVVLKTSQIDYNGRFCMSSAAAAGNRAFGLDRGLPFPLDDISSAECVLLVGSNVAETMPPFMQRLGQGRSLVVVDPRRTGTDLALANGLLFLAIELGLVDTGYDGVRTSGWDAVRSTVAGYWPGRVERLTGVAEPDLREAVRLLATASTAMVLTARGAEQHAHGVDTTSAWINLALANGKERVTGVGLADGRHVYKKLVVRDGLLVGALLLGDLSTVGAVTQAFDRASPLPADRTPLLVAPRRAPAPDDLEDDDLVCTCNAVTAGALRDSGCRTVAEAALATRATTGCGTCAHTVAGLLRRPALEKESA